MLDRLIPSKRSYWLFALSLLLGGEFALAETIPSAPGTEIVSDLQVSWGWGYPFCAYDGGIWYPTVRAAAEALIPVVNPCMRSEGYKFVSVISADETTAVASWLRVSGGTYTYQMQYHGVCAAGSTWNGSDCVKTVYSCPSTGGWVLSADKLTCSRCPDPLILNSDNACIGVEDKTIGKQGCQDISDQPPPPWSNQP